VGSEIARIIDQLEREHAGDPWHGSPLRQILEGIDHEQAAQRPLAGAHTIWELVLHMISWKNEVRRRIAGAPAAVPLEGDWPAPPGPSREAWRETLAALEASHRALVSAVAGLPEEKLFQPTHDPRDRESGAGVDHYVLLHGIVQHDVYHAGQIALLKKAGIAGQIGRV
jgi:uncharacterized damage-inducible protein DinB